MADCKRRTFGVEHGENCADEGGFGASPGQKAQHTGRHPKTLGRVLNGPVLLILLKSYQYRGVS